MSVQITFESDSGSGLVAAGTYILEAAKRLGVTVPAECRGRGECDSCVVVIVRGAELLAAATSAEEKVLGRERLEHPTQAERLACQAIMEKPGEIIVRLPPVREGEQQPSGFANTLRGLPFKEKVGALIELEAATITEALNSLRGSYHGLIDKFLNLNPQSAKEAEQTTKAAKQATKDSPGPSGQDTKRKSRESN